MTTVDILREGARIGGAVEPVTGARFVVENPADGTVLAEVHDGDAADATRAADAAAAAFGPWAATAPRARAEILLRAFQLMTERHAELARLVSAENGKPRADALGEIAYAAEFLRWYAEEGVRVPGVAGVAPAGGARIEVTHRPVGVAALVTPWNFPAAMATRKIGPALAAGCTVVLKPAAETPLTAFALADLMAEAGVPAGVVNVVPTTDPGAVVDALLAHPAVRKLSFTGSTAVGRHLLARAGQRVQNCSMELGGNAPFVVCADADLDAAVAGALVAKLRNSGQACTAANRFFVHETVADEFTARFVAAVDALPLGPADDPTAAIGPLIGPRAVQRVQRCIDAAVAAGARVVNQPAAVPTDGHFLAPHVLRDVPEDAALVTDEIFGPVAPILTWADPDDLVARANATELGLAGYVFAGDTGSARRVARALDCGMVGVNRGLVSEPAAPFGGVKQSGLGREGGTDGILAFLEAQYLSVQE
ncbi:NAD-dependent succinate-semialdehyde dehydrogenase [Pseudonocardia halophobica]|nr:NAD-dependent succinate-semialdehyde dehydrogenase [Pseudonocardia halophobica]